MAIALSRYNNYCEGYNLSSPGKYIVCLNLGIGIAEIGLSHSGSTVLDETNAFDRAEVDDVNIGQINMITVSSFCGPGGLLWGYDICKMELNKIKSSLFNNVYDGASLISATRQLIGTVNKPNFSILPGSHVLCATKNIKKIGPAKIYSAIAMGIPHDREKHACLMMEDAGEIPINSKPNEFEEIIQNSLVKSILEVGKNQHVAYEKIFVSFKVKEVPENNVGCALVASPYLALPKSFAKYIKNDNMSVTDLNKIK